MNKISDDQNHFEKSFEDIGAKHSSAPVTGEIRGDLKVTFGASDKFMTIRFFSSVENANALRCLIWCLGRASLSHE